MSKLSTIVDTKEGQADISTKKKWMFLVPMPHTAVLPYPCPAADLARLGTFIKWTTSDAAVLATLHEAIVHLVEEVGVSGLVEIRNSARMAEQVWNALAGPGSGLQAMAEMAAHDGASFPVPPVVLKHIKGFQ